VADVGVSQGRVEELRRLSESPLAEPLRGATLSPPAIRRQRWHVSSQYKDKARRPPERFVKQAEICIQEFSHRGFVKATVLIWSWVDERARV
jgi:hypothetical protein